MTSNLGDDEDDSVEVPDTSGMNSREIAHALGITNTDYLIDRPKAEKEFIAAVKNIKTSHPEVAQFLMALNKKEGLGAALGLLERLEYSISIKKEPVLKQNERFIAEEIVRQSIRQPGSRRNFFMAAVFGAASLGFGAESYYAVNQKYGSRSLFEDRSKKPDLDVVAVSGAAASIGAAIIAGVHVNKALSYKILDTESAKQKIRNTLNNLPDIIAPAIQDILGEYRKRMEVKDKQR